jgi:signal transduction histidine kinase
MIGTSAPKRDGSVQIDSRWASGFWKLLILLATLGSHAPQVCAESPAAITSLASMAALSSEDSAKGLTVIVRGTVTYCDRDRGVLFIQDAADAVSVRIGRNGGDFDLQPGQLVEVEGITVQNRSQSFIRSKALRLISSGQLPEPLPLNDVNFSSQASESHRAMVQGWIPAVSTAGNQLAFSIVVRPGLTLDVVLNDRESPEAKALAGALVEATGVYSRRFDSAGRITGGRLNVTSLEDIHISKTLRLVSVAEAGAPSGKEGATEPFRTRGSVLSHSLGDYLIIRDASGSLRIPYRGLNYFNPGSLVEVFAYPLPRQIGMVLTNVTVKLVPPDTSTEEPAAAIIAPKLANTNLPTLTRISQVRKLSPQEASRGYPVSIVGVITYFDMPSYLHFVQDETSGIYFDLSRIDNLPPVHPGQRVQIQGFSGPGDYAPILISQSVQPLKDDNFPTPESVTFAKLMGGNYDSQWVLLKGVIRNQWITTNSTSLALFAGDGLVKVALPAPPQWLTSSNLVDAGVEVRGVCRTIFDDHRRLQGVELQLPDWKQLSVVTAPFDDPFHLPVRPINDLFQFHADAEEMHRVRLMGIVTLRRADGSIYIQDGSGGIQVQPSSTASNVKVGAMVDIVGFPVIVEKSAMLQEAQLHTLRRAPPLDPVDLKAETPLEAGLEATLVRFQGQVLSHFTHGSEEVLTVRLGQKAVDGVIERASGQEQFNDLEPGTLVRLTGVYVSQIGNAASAPVSRVMLRSQSDLEIISRPSWWTLQRTVWALAGLAGVLLLALGWVLSLRRQVRQRTGELHDEIEHHKRTEVKLEGEIAERKRMETEVERSHQELLIASRQAGMAEVATSVLHNVGNVLNSVNVSAGVVGEKIRNSKVSNIARVAELIKSHSGDLAHYLDQDPKGRQLPQYLARLAQHLDAEQKVLLGELDSLRKNVEHIKGIVGMQQSYAKVFGAAEAVKPTELVEDALRLNSGALVRHEVRVIREYEPNLPEITVDRHKLLQILVNLICNAKKACDDSVHPEKLLTIRVANGEGFLKICVTDNGVGIPQENLTRIFNHGFTTRKDGHGFGLHSGALAAKEMGGALLVQSDGHGKGASFTVQLPVTALPGES